MSSEHNYTLKLSSEPIIAAFEMKPNLNITFHNGGKQVGVLDFNGPEMTFTGDADESAKLFFDFIATTFKARLEHERADERENYKWDIHSCGPTCKRYACVAMREAVEAERERFALECIDLVAFYGGPVDLEAAIRARSKT